jgi:hypothetical protein
MRYSFMHTCLAGLIPSIYYLFTSHTLNTELDEEVIRAHVKEYEGGLFWEVIQ